MSPTISAGSYLIFHRFTYPIFLTVGRVVKVQHPRYGMIVKRIKYIDMAGFYWLEGENIASVTCSQMGAIDRQLIIGIAFYAIRK